MKKIVSASVLVLFLLSVVGGQYFLYKSYRSHVHAQAEQILKAMAIKDAEVLAFSKKDFANGLPYTIVPDKDDEIIFLGEFFDIKETRTTHDSIFLYVYRDTNEKLLVQHFEKQEREKDESPSGTMLQQFSNLFVFTASPGSYVLTSHQTGVLIQILFQKQIFPVFICSDSPPPWV